MKLDLAEGLPEVPRIGMRASLVGALETMTWLGRGPHESYWDRKSGAPFGLYSGKVGELVTSYVRPQENANRSDVSWVALTDRAGQGLLVLHGAELLQTSAWPYSMEELEKARHTNELPQGKSVTFNVDLQQMGVGGDTSWGAHTHDEYKLLGKSYEYGFYLRPVRDSGQALDSQAQEAIPGSAL
jgi:beta-galactosidase